MDNYSSPLRTQSLRNNLRSSRTENKSVDRRYERRPADNLSYVAPLRSINNSNQSLIEEYTKLKDRMREIEFQIQLEVPSDNG